MPATSPRYALLSVTDKSGIVDFARALVARGYSILSTGGTAELLRQQAIAVLEVQDYTQHPEVLEGRVKTLHPKIHGGILFDRDQASQKQEAARHGMNPIDLVVVNLYRFQEAAVAKTLPLAEAIAHIDIGGPTMLRAAAKNYQHVLAVIDPADYPRVLRELDNNGQFSLSFRAELAGKTFAATAAYDQAVAAYFAAQSQLATTATSTGLSDSLALNLQSLQVLRYGENPQQQARLYAPRNARTGFAQIQILQGKELSYNNFLDLDAAAALVQDLAPLTAVAIIKHTNPCGVAAAERADIAGLFHKALACDPISAFGGIIAVNRPVDGAAARAMAGLFIECIIAPAFSAEAVQILSAKKNLRLVQAAFINELRTHPTPLEMRSIQGAVLIQERDQVSEVAREWPTVSHLQANDQLRDDLSFAMTVAKHVKSNAIVFARELQTLAIGAGQMSRIDAAQWAAQKAKSLDHSLRDAALASDAFFPFRDVVDLAKTLGIAGIVQPGGSQRDQESIDACNEHGIAMLHTGIRHFKH